MDRNPFRFKRKLVMTDLVKEDMEQADEDEDDDEAEYEESYGDDIYNEEVDKVVSLRKAAKADEKRSVRLRYIKEKLKRAIMKNIKS